ncbi:MAG: acetylornithine deacetylase [Pseudomonadota bacterium]
MSPAAPKSLELIRRLIAFDTTSVKSNLALIDFVREFLASHGIESQLVHNEERSKANLYATIGPEDRPGVMLSGHSDVVPVTGQAWDSDPFDVLERDGKLYGRGTADMKSFIAAALAFVPEMAASDLKTPIHLAISYDEEIGCVGVRRLLEMMAGLPIRPAMCVIGEPTGMKVVIGHKGKRAFRVRVRGLECHSSLAPAGVNAVDYAAELIVFIRQLAKRLAAEGPFEAEYEVAHTTLHSGLVQGGTALNIVPKDCFFDFEIRNLPDQDPEPLIEEITAYARNTLEPEMQAVDPASGFAFEALSGYPGLDTGPGEEVVTFVKSLVGANDHKKITFGTEGGLFQGQLGVPTVVCGPGHIAQAHKPNEWIELSQVAACEAFMGRLIERLAT